MCLCLSLFKFILLDVLWVSWIYVLLPFVILENSQPFHLHLFFIPAFSVLSFWDFNYVDFSSLGITEWLFHTLFCFLFMYVILYNLSFCVSALEISTDLSSGSLILSLTMSGPTVNLPVLGWIDAPQPYNIHVLPRTSDGKLIWKELRWGHTEVSWTFNPGWLVYL